MKLSNMGCVLDNGLSVGLAWFEFWVWGEFSERVGLAGGGGESNPKMSSKSVLGWTVFGFETSSKMLSKSLLDWGLDLAVGLKRFRECWGKADLKGNKGIYMYF